MIEDEPTTRISRPRSDCQSASQHQHPPQIRVMAAGCLRWSLAICILLVGCRTALALDGDCQALSDQYLDKHHKEASPHTGTNMVYFLHVPRTAGRTLHSCFLKTGTPPKDRCPKAYDHLRINVTVPQCRLLSSHDDFSVVSMLAEDVAVLTHLRDPVDRVLSAYEFAVEVSARMLNRPRNFKKRGDKIATEDVWPWSYLVPFFVQDLRLRVGQHVSSDCDGMLHFDET